MAKQNINVGTTANDKKGDSLRAAFVKVNANFTELYTALGLAADPNLNLGAFEFNGSVMTTTDSSNMTIGDEGTTINIGGDLVPTVNLNSNLGSASKKWHSLYVGTGSVYIGDAQLSLENGKLQSSVGFNLTGSIGEVSGAVEWDNVLNKPTIPTSFDSLVNGTETFTLSATGNATFSGETGGINRGIVWDYGAVAGGVNSRIRQDEDGLTVRAYTENSGSYAAPVRILTNQDVNERVWQFDGTGNLTIPGAIQWDLNANSPGFTDISINKVGDNLSISTNAVLDPYTWTFSNQSKLTFPNGAVIDTYADGAENQTYFWGAPGQFMAVRGMIAEGVYGGGLNINTDGNIGILAQNGESSVGWSFNVGGSITFPNGSEQTTAFTGTANIARNIESEGDVSIRVNLTDSTQRVWRFGEDGELTLPNGSTIGDGEAGSGVPITTARGTILLGNLAECAGGESHFHIMKAGQQAIDLFLGDDSNYVKLPDTGGVEIATQNFNQYSWIFGTDGDLTLPAGGDIKDSTGTSVLGGGGLPTITVPASTGTDYKGLQVAYGGFHTNTDQSSTRNVTKVVIHKPAATTVDITEDSNSDYFQVSGLSGDSVLAMFVIIGDVNGEKPLSDIQAFAEEVIDTVILDGGVEGEFNTVDEMKAAFYANYADLALAVDGLATDFEFYQNNVAALNGGVTTVREGTGATFDITANGDGTYDVSDPAGTGTNYLVDHRIKILGTDLGGATPDNDLELQVSSVNGLGGITSVFSYGTSVGLGVYTLVSGTNYNVGSGFAVNGVYKYETYLDSSNNGTNYVVGDVITLLGSNITNGTSPENDITITVRNVFGSGEVNGFDISGTVPEVWRTNNISDGGNDEYDTGNYIDSSLANQIAYNSGNTVTDGVAAFGTGSSYSFVYEDSVFGLFVTGNNSTTIGTSGSGPDSGSTIISGYIYGPNTAEQTFDNAVTHLNIVGNPVISFTKTNNGDEVDVLIADDGEGAGVGITRDNNGGIYNPYRDDGWDEDVSPSGTQWNIDGWDNLTDVESRTYQPLYAAFGFGGLGQKIVGAECVMYLPDNGKYYAVKFTQWTQNNAGGGFAYTRQELDLDSPDLGIRFADGTRQTTAYVPPTTVKLVSPRERRIEEVYGYKEVAFTIRTVDQEFTGVTLSPSLGPAWDVFIDGTVYTELYAYVTNFSNQPLTLLINGVEYSVEPYISGNNIVLYSYNENDGAVPVSYSEGDAFTVRKYVGGEPVTWWNKSELPGGSSDFRGAVIDYHAFISGRGTIVGTIHIVDDDGEENITHTEVSSGSSDLEYSDLWLVTDEGRIQYRQLDGGDRTLKVQWTAKVFYGSEYYDD